MSGQIPRWPVIGAGSLIAGWLTLDAVRQSRLGVADAGLWFVLFAGLIAVGAALAVGRWPEGRRMALLILWWLITAVGDDVGVMWPASRIAMTVLLPVLALQPRRRTIHRRAHRLADGLGPGAPGARLDLSP